VRTHACANARIGVCACSPKHRGNAKTRCTARIHALGQSLRPRRGTGFGTQYQWRPRLRYCGGSSTHYPLLLSRQLHQQRPHRRRRHGRPQPESCRGARDTPRCPTYGQVAEKSGSTTITALRSSKPTSWCERVIRLPLSLSLPSLPSHIYSLCQPGVTDGAVELRRQPALVCVLHTSHSTRRGQTALYPGSRAAGHSRQSHTRQQEHAVRACRTRHVTHSRFSRVYMHESSFSLVISPALRATLLGPPAIVA